MTGASTTGGGGGGGVINVWSWTEVEICLPAQPTRISKIPAQARRDTTRTIERDECRIMEVPLGSKVLADVD